MRFLSNIAGNRFNRVSLVLLAAVAALIIPVLSFASEAVPGGG